MLLPRNLPGLSGKNIGDGMGNMTYRGIAVTPKATESLRSSVRRSTASGSSADVPHFYNPLAG